MRLSLVLIGTFVMALLAACTPRMVLDPAGLTIIRTYRIPATVEDPQPVWNPNSYLILARSLNGFALLQEGQGRQERFESQESRQTWFPAWLNRDQFVFGPMNNVSAVADGRVVAATDGLTLVTVVDNGLKCDVTRTPLTNKGFRPRPANNLIYAQLEAKMLVVDYKGTVSDAGEGFYAEPQPGGDGVAWQDTPVYEKDRWTGKVGVGTLFVRWKRGQITEVAGGCEAAWTSTGGLVCTVQRAAPSLDRQWWSGGTDVVYLAGPDAQPEIIAKDARSPSPHPHEPLVAVNDGSAGVRVVSLRNPRPAESLLITTGKNPKWSYDGTRLLTVELNLERDAKRKSAADSPASIVVHVLREQRTNL